MKCIEERRSVRKYKAQDVEDEKILQILESARLAPSGSNTQPWRFIVVRDDETKRRLVEADHNQRWMLSAPVFIVCIADIQCRIKSESSIFLDEECPLPELKLIIRDTAIAIEHILLEATEVGLSTCWTGWFEQRDVRPILSIPQDKYVCGIITVGYGDESNTARPRHELKDIIMHEKWMG